MTTPPPVTDAFARFVAETDYSTISDHAIANAKMHILDTLGAALAAVSTEAASIAFDYCKRAGRSEESSIWGTRLKASPPMAAFVNGLLGHALDFDDWDAFIHAGHPTCMVAGAALSLGEAETLMGRLAGVTVVVHHHDREVDAPKYFLAVHCGVQDLCF